MTENTYYKPRLVIGDKEITKGMSGSVTFSGNSQANTCICTITDPHFQNYKLYNKELKVYLNYGADDGVPIFRGLIKEIKPNDTQTGLVAVDPRMLITGDTSELLHLTDDDNYDGYSLAGFLQKIIEEKINTKKTLIGLDCLRDTNPIVTMNNERTKEPVSIYSLIIKKLKSAVDDADIEKPLTYFIDMVDDGLKSNITFLKEKQLTETPSLYLGFSNGLISYTNNRRVPATRAVGGGADFTFSSEPRGSVSKKISGKFKDRNEARIEAISDIFLNNRETDEISLQVNKGHYIGLGSIVRLDIDEEDIKGNHRLTSKKIAFDESGVKLSMSLNKKPLILSDFISI
tara:strand:+ start:5111 stop:6145 length:1035 start_codon:yes stop_codon:yes gene_type:complete